MPEWVALDPLPIPPKASRDSAEYWRWLSKVTLHARAEAKL